MAAPTSPGATHDRFKPRDVRLTRPLYVDPASQAATAAQSDPRLARIAGTAQSSWLTDAYPVATIRRTVQDYATRANTAGRTPVFTIYAIPGRDCGGQSAGGLDATTYRAWVTEVAAALKGQHAMAVLEPDAVSLMGRCTGQEDWARLLRFATKNLAAAGVWVYVDAGHSSWIPAAEMAARLVRSGIKRARGFSTNVANFVATGVEKTYARQVAKELKARGVSGMHVVIDTSRNGAGAAPEAPWCNPVEARLGRQPGMRGQGTLDGYLWVKRPGESDGACLGGPSAGTFWTDGALRLLGLL